MGAVVVTEVPSRMANSLSPVKTQLIVGSILSQMD